MPGSLQTRHLGSACRIYKNSANKVIAIDAIDIVIDTRRITREQWHHSAYKTHKRTLLHLGTGDRVVSKILMIGDYTSLTEDGGNYLSLKWTGEHNDIVIPLNDLAQIGDTL